MKKILLLIISIVLILGACTNTADNKMSKNQSINNTETPKVIVDPEYTQKTVNENGVTIYGKIVDANTASETGKKVIEKKKIADKNIAKEGLSVTYSEYYSEAYGGTVILRTDNKDGSSEIYNENGERFISGEKVDIDMETLLQNYRISNAMADAMNEKYKKK